MPDIIDKYLATLSEKEKITYRLAKEYLGTSFNIKKSIGFIKWLAKN